MVSESVWASAGFFSGVDKWGVYEESPPAGSRDEAPVAVWRDTSEVDDWLWK